MLEALSDATCGDVGEWIGGATGRERGKGICALPALHSAEYHRTADGLHEWHVDDRHFRATIRGLEAENRELADAVEYAWTIICNAGEGDWTRESAEWQGAADRFRTQYHEKILPLLTLKPEAPL